MPRRAKIVILILLVVLAAIALADVVLHWHPENPLRFSISTLQHQDLPKGEPAQEKALSIPCYLTVTNTTSTGVALYSADALNVHPKTPAMDFAGLMKAANFFRADPPVDREYWLVPPHGSIRCALMTGSRVGGAAPVQGREIEIRYAWVSHPKLRYRSLCRWLHNHLPPSLSRHIPWPWIESDVTPLVPAPSTSP